MATKTKAPKHRRGGSGRPLHRQKELPDYGTAPVPAETNNQSVLDMASELPVTRNVLAGDIAKWDDPLLTLDPAAYLLLRTCPPIIKGVRKLAIRTAKLNWSVFGGGRSRDALAEGVSGIDNWAGMCEWLLWARVEGTRFMQMKQHPLMRRTAGSTIDINDGLVTASFFMGGRRKFNAGGEIEWDGRNLIQVREVTSVTQRDTKKLPRWQFIVHRPGAGSSPEGDLDLGVALYNNVAKPHSIALPSGSNFVRLFGVPIKIIEVGGSDLTRAGMLSKMQQSAEKLARLQGGDQAALTDDEIVKLLQADAKGLDGIVSWLRYLESVADDMITQSVLTGAAGIANANRTGDTKTHKTEEDQAAFIAGCELADSLNRDFVPWFFRKNPDFAPSENEPMPYIWPEAPEDDDTQDVSVGETDTVDQPQDQAPRNDEDVINADAA